MAEPTHPERESNPRIFKPPRRNALGTWDGLGEGKRAPHSPLPLRGLGPRIGEEAAPHSERTRPWRLTARAVSKRPTLRHRTTSRAGERTDRGTTNPAPPWGAGRFGRIDSHGHVGTAGAVCENRLGPGQPLPRRPRQRGRGGHSLTRRHHSRHRVPPPPDPAREDRPRGSRRTRPTRPHRGPSRKSGSRVSPTSGLRTRGGFKSTDTQEHGRDRLLLRSVFPANDPSAGSPTETLLRLLLPLDSQVRPSSQHSARAVGRPRRGRSEDLTKPSNR